MYKERFDRNGQRITSESSVLVPFNEQQIEGLVIGDEEILTIRVTKEVNGVVAKGSVLHVTEDKFNIIEVFNPDRGTKRIQIPAEQWESFSEAYSSDTAAEHKGNKPIPVKTFEYGGFRYTVFGTIYQAFSLEKSSTMKAYKLIPMTMYQGETTLVYHDSDAIRQGLRHRGDMTGLIVSYQGNLMVCAEQVFFEKGLPTMRPLSVAEARAYNEKQTGGWRFLNHSESKQKWFTFHGHPVVLYQFDREWKNVAILFWRKGAAIQEMTVAEDIGLVEVNGSMLAMPVMNPVKAHQPSKATSVQLDLFG